MSEFIWHLKCLYWSWKNRKSVPHEYDWYLYLVKTTIKNFFRGLKPVKYFRKESDSDLPF